MERKIIIASILLAFVAIGCSDDDSSDFRQPIRISPSLDADNYSFEEENPFVEVAQNAVSTFSIDADGGSYSNARRFVTQENQLPPRDAVRTEEFLNYFDLDYQYSPSEHPVSINGEVSSCPWNPANRLLRIGIKGKDLPQPRPASNFVLLVDLSGSMASSDRLDLLKEGFRVLVNQLSSNDKMSIIAYGTSATTLLESVPGNQKNRLTAIINSLGSSGYSNGEDGLQKAYELAERNFVVNGNNRIILATDGDFNVGLTAEEDLVDFIEEKKRAGIFLTAIGVGRDNLNEAVLEQIANRGNGNYEYIDNLIQAKKVFAFDFEEFFTVAKDVKVQVEFNPTNVKSYRLIGYENRVLDQSDFDDPDADGGEIGAGQSLTALYEIVPQLTTDKSLPVIDFSFNYKNPADEVVKTIDLAVFDQDATFQSSSQFMKFSSSVAAYGMMLRRSQYKGTTNFDSIKIWSNGLNLSDPHGFKAEFVQLLSVADNL